jgi:hypothetical protein
VTRRAALLSFVLAAAASASYHWVRYPSRNGVSQPIYDRYDLASLPDGHTLPFFINEPGALQLAANDSATALLSQIKAAALVWNTVETADIKLSFGGMRTASSPSMNSPWIEVEFSDELAPGIVALGGPTGRVEAVTGPNGTYTPIVKSLLRLPRNLTTRPSWGERLFLTLVHEFGHTLGLQHSWSSGVMSTELTRATSKARPLSADDAAGLSFLYPAAQFRQTTGTISGRVTLNNNGVHLASVVAYSARGWAVSTLTHPDGTYRLEGLAPGAYYVYAHPLPPALAGEPQPVNLDLPTDPAGRILPGGAFDLQFYPGTTTPQTQVTVTAEQTAANINFAVRARASVNLHSVQSYSFLGQETIKPATIVAANGRGTVVFTGFGATQAAPNFSVNTLLAGDGVIGGTLRAYSAGYLQVDVAVPASGGEGPRPLLFSLGDEQYILPSAYTVVSRTPPTISSVSANADRSVTLSGQNLIAGSRVWFDGVQARVRTAENGQLTVSAPGGPSGHRSAITVLNPDGQSSVSFQNTFAPQLYQHEASEAVSFTLSPTTLPAGAETLVEVTTTGLDLEERAATLATGTSDVAVRRLWVTGPNKALALVSIPASAAPSATQWTLCAGLDSFASQGPLQVLTGVRVMHLATGSLVRSALTPGALVTVPVVNGPANVAAAAFSVTVADRPALVNSYSAGQLSFQLPSGMPAGPVVVRATISGEALPPAILVIASPVPAIVAAISAGGGSAISAAAPARGGEVLNLLVSNVLEPGQTVDSVKVRLISPIGNQVIEHTVQSVLPASGQAGSAYVQVVLSTQTPAVTSLPLIISADERLSAIYPLPYRP